MTFGKIWPKFADVCSTLEFVGFEEGADPVLASIDTVVVMLRERYVKTGRVKKVSDIGKNEALQDEEVPSDILAAFEKVQIEFYKLESMPRGGNAYQNAA